MKRLLPVCIVAIWSICAALPTSAQDPQDYFNIDDFSSEALYATGELGVGARAMGLGGNYVGIADDATALYHNPAGLAQLVRIETSLGLHSLRDESTHEMFGATATADASYSGLDHIAIAYPFPTYRGSLVLAGGVFRARSSDLDTSRRDRRTGATNYDDEFDRAQDGGLWQWTGGLAVDLLRDLSFGFNLSYWHGTLEDDQLRSIDESGVLNYRYDDRLVTESDADGFSFDLGLMTYAGEHGRIGFVLRSPVWLNIDGAGTYFLDEAGSSTQDYVYIVDEPRLPWSMAVGGSYGIGWALLTGELRYKAWDEVEGVPRSGSDIPGADPDYDAQWGGGLGLEITVPGSPLRLRGGWSRDPEPYRLHLGQPSTMAQERDLWSVGGGVLLSDAFALDIGAAFAEFERADRQFPQVSERRSERRIHVTGAYRF